ncbi:short-chain dehydrogenase/reductase SDR [Rhizobium freirei PRF 81]|uniref:Short-chain dehydrogenase/reductase SDR n=1 Tax=Rhizobium freirei PRF 81 TaxID=363754 RepID=N6UAQ5_9HYPH|nr:SDR family oxidoreductase [Rhizobium freirei]ENN89589.1 short-chain dehydrogenase/reductase SDR [Rhizobium freirei PRF 81]
MTDDAPVLLVTGGSRGIGAAICLAAAQHGWAVAVNYASSEEAAEAVVGTIRDAGGKAIAIAGDVGKAEDIKSVFAKIDAHFGRIDGLVNNAGIVDAMQRLDEMTPERIDRMFRINITGSMLAAAEAVRRMSTRHGGKGGVIINVSSMAATLGGGGQYVDYAASKGAIDTFTVGLAREVAAESIRVNAVRPGIIDTDIHAAAGLPDRARDIAPQLPMKRAGTSDEVADAVLYLLSPHASYITGALLDVSGGR